MENDEEGTMRKYLLLSSILLLGACSAHDVRCGGHLEPINPPSPAAQLAHKAPAVGTVIVTQLETP